MNCKVKRSRGRRRLTAVLIFILAAISTVQPVHASDSIKTVRIRIGVERFDDQKRPVLTARGQGSGYEVEEVRYICGQASGPGAEKGKLSEPEAVRQNRRPASSSICETQAECEISLAAEDGKSFAVMEQEDIRLSGVEGSCVKAVRKQGGAMLVLTVKLTGLENIVGEITSAKLSPFGPAVWEGAPNARFYQVQLYCDGERAGLSHRTEQTVFDFSPLMTDEGVYSYKVTPYSEKKKRGKSQESAWVRLDRRQAEENREKQSRGFGDEKQSGWEIKEDGLHYWYRDGLYPQNTWLELDGGRYYFNGSGCKL